MKVNGNSASPRGVSAGELHRPRWSLVTVGRRLSGGGPEHSSTRVPLPGTSLNVPATLESKLTLHFSVYSGGKLFHF